VSAQNLHIGIAGAGIAGLIAGVQLQKAGHSVFIFESRSNTGGRIRSLEVAGLLVESGPEFIHGNFTETFGLLRKYNIPVEPVNGKMYSARGGKIEESYDMAEGWDQLLNKMRSADPDLPFHEFLINNFPGKRFTELRNAAIGFAEGYDLADVETASTRALVSEWELEDSEQYHIPSGYGMLVSSLENEFTNLGGKIFLNHAVECIDWHSADILVRVKGNQVFRMDKVLISLPLGILQHTAPPSESVIFLPALVEKQRAFSQIGFGTVIKIVMIWETAFWKPRVPEALFIFSDHFIPTWWTPYPQDFPLLTGWLGGPRAADVSDKPDIFFLEKALESLSSIFSIPTVELKNKLKDFRIFNWKNESWSRGAYSYSLVGSTIAKAMCREPVQDRIYFTGEAYYEGPYPGTVEAAVVSGLETARQLLS
jgi:monoamine oxidase